MLIYFIQQFSLIVNMVNAKPSSYQAIVGFHVLILLTTVSIEKILMESRARLLQSKVNAENSINAKIANKYDSLLERYEDLTEDHIELIEEFNEVLLSEDIYTKKGGKKI
ncbi:MAG: hypothetical protein ACE5FT_02655 [Candidatus Nanoarchaeia archaeon]